MKRIIATLIACCIFLASMPILSATAVDADPAVAQAVGTQDDGVPFILIRGVDFGALYTDYGTPEQAPAVPPITAGGIASALFKAVGSGIRHLSVDRAVKEIFDYAVGIMGNLACDEDGNPVYDLGLNRFPLSAGNYENQLITGGGWGVEEGIVKSAAERYGADSTYYFTYDWRLNPLDICDEINDMVNRALAEHNTTKVNLVCASMGGLEAVAYLSKYGYDKVNRCVFLSSTFYGVYIASDLFCGRMTVTEPSLYNFLIDKTQDNRALNITVNLLYKTGVIKLASSFANGFIGRYKGMVYSEYLQDVIATMPVFWGLVQPEDYSQALHTMFGGQEEEYAGIIAISRQLQAMMKGRDDLLKEATANGVQFAVVANYNRPAMPIYERAGANSDGGLETALVSGGATVAGFGKTLGSDYVPADPGYISPDNVIDASTCLFPDFTWFVKDGEHVACSYGTEYSDFLFWIVDCEGQPTVAGNPRYPQFMVSGNGQTLAGLTALPAKPKPAPVLSQKHR